MRTLKLAVAVAASLGLNSLAAEGVSWLPDRMPVGNWPVPAAEASDPRDAVLTELIGEESGPAEDAGAMVHAAGGGYDEEGIIPAAARSAGGVGDCALGAAALKICPGEARARKISKACAVKAMEYARTHPAPAYCSPGKPYKPRPGGGGGSSPHDNTGGRCTRNGDCRYPNYYCSNYNDRCGWCDNCRTYCGDNGKGCNVR